MPTFDRLVGTNINGDLPDVVNASLNARYATAAQGAKADAAQVAAELDSDAASLFSDPGSEARGELVTVVEDTIWAPEASGDDAVDTAAIQALINAAQAAGKTTTIELRRGAYKITHLVTTRNSPQPYLKGQGRATDIEFTDAGVGIDFRGGSNLRGGGLSDVLLRGNGATAVQINGAGGLQVKRVTFDTLAKGVRFLNNTDGLYTELAVVEDSVFWASCDRWLEFVSEGSGNTSMHGSGFRNCHFNGDFNDTTGRIYIGAGPRLYNSPWDGTFWVRGGHIVDLSSSNKFHTLHGNMRVESMGSAAGETGGTTYLYSPTVGSSAGMFFAGEVMHLGAERFRINRPNMYTARLVNRVDQGMGAGETIWYGLASQEFAVDLTTGANTTIPMGEGMVALIQVNINAGGALVSSYSMIARRNKHNSSGVITLLDDGSSAFIDTNSYGHPTFAITNNFVITNPNWPASGVTARISFNQIATRNIPNTML